jgi:uncharacterized membrane protein YsdA (DUF1294 family)/cold shock CspA family protein
MRMRYAGRIQDWNHDKGYGFVAPKGGGSRVFVHVRAFQRTSRHPVDGDLVSYALARDPKGRSNAVQVRFAGTRIAPTSERRLRALPIPRLAIGIAALAGVAAAAWLGRVPAVIAIAYWALSGLSFLLYFGDKSAAGRHRARRTPENTLHLVDLLGGWPGALLAQHAYRHKTVKASFQAVFWITVVANVAAVAWLVASGRADALGGWP